MTKRVPVWKESWVWPWAEALPRHPQRVFAGLGLMKARLARGKVWAARFKYADRFDGSYEKKPARLPMSRAPHARRSVGRRGRRKS